MNAEISIKELSKTFNSKRRALKNVSVDVAPGEMVALIGASGSGKSTLLRHIAGLLTGDPAKEGSLVSVRGKIVQQGGVIDKKIRSQRKEIGFIFQQFNLIARLSVLTNVLCGFLGRSSAWRTILLWFTTHEKSRAMQCLSRVGIADQAMQRASTLSGGQQQRAAIARCLAQGAKVILADEPISSLDPASSKNVMEILAKINREDQVTIVVSLHQVDYAIKYCPRTIALRDGEVVYDGPSANLSRPLLASLYGDASNELFADIDDQVDATPSHIGPKSDLAAAVA
ncbi:MAG: phosphonate ABC transporter ATP-binding protein [Pseudomonadota bacterium]|nr:phosphonate ABC transporter ATP-binding protein [Pseudomonadota bacterium]